MECGIFKCFLLLAAAMLSSCGVKQTEEGMIDVSKPRGAVLEDLTSDIRVIPVREDSSFLLGNVMDLKSYGSFLFLHDDGSRKIYCMEDDGRFMYALDALGRAENEYLDIGTYTFDAARLSLVIFERTRRELKWYTGPDAVYAASHKLGSYASAMEWLQGSRYVLVQEAWREFEPALVIYDVATDSVVAQLPLREDQADLMLDIAFSRMGPGRETYVCVPGLVNTVYRADSAGFTPEMEIAMTPNKLGEEYWSGDYDEAKEQELFDATQSGEGGIAIAPSFFVKTGTAVSFYYFPGRKGSSSWHNLPAMNLCLLRDGKTRVVDRLTLRGTKTELAPLGVHGGRYVALVETALLDASGDPGPTALKIRDFAEAGIEHVLVEYGF